MIKDRVKELRDLYGLTQEEFSKRLGVARNSIASYEIGRREPTNAMIALICREFMVSEKWLRSGEGPMFPPRAQEEELTEELRGFLREQDPIMNEILLMLMQGMRKMTAEEWAPIKAHIKKLSELIESENE